MRGKPDDPPVLDTAYRESDRNEVTTKQKKKRKQRSENASTGVTAATMRALSARMLTFYFRAPVKAFFRPRIDYMGYARAINPNIQAGKAWSWRMTSPALLASAVRQYGWGFIPNYFLPPLIANTAVGAVLYTAYLQTLGLLHEPSSHATKRVYPPPPPLTAFTAGLAAGAVQSVLAAPLDALQNRFQSTELKAGKYRSMWHYAHHKTREIGARGIFAGWSLSLVRDALGAGVFFATFEVIKSQCFYNYVSWYYGTFGKLSGDLQTSITTQSTRTSRPEIHPHYMMEPSFLLAAGAAASVGQALIHHPVSRIQEIYYSRLEWIDSLNRLKLGWNQIKTLQLYAAAYRKTLQECLIIARQSGGLRAWLYKDFAMTTLRQVPSTSAGLIVFEILRRKYGNDDDAVRIPKSGYEIVLI